MNLENKLKKSMNNKTMYTKRECVMNRSQKATIAGWREWVELPDIGIPHLETMIDTGTDITVLYASFIEHYRRDNDLWVRFSVNTLVGEECSRVVCQAPVKSTEIHYGSGNQNESFFVIEATIQIGKLQTQQDLVLKKQNGNQYIMRLGRNALQDLNLQVDPCSSYVHGDYSDEQQKQMHYA